MRPAGGQATLAYEICLSPGDKLAGPMSGSALLTDSAIGGTHWLTLSSGQVTSILWDAHAYFAEPDGLVQACVVSYSKGQVCNPT